MSLAPLDFSPNPRFRPTRARPADDFAKGKPKCPPHIKADPVALECWRRMVNILAARGTVTKGDGPAIELYVACYVDWLAARAEVREHGLIVESVISHAGETETVRKENPAQKIADRCASTMRQLLKEFGATPAARERAKVAKGQPKEALPIGSVGWLLQQHKTQEATSDEPERDVEGNA